MLKKIFKKTAAIIAAAAMLVTGTCTTYSGSESIIRTEQITAEAATTEKSPGDRLVEEALKYKGCTQANMVNKRKNNDYNHAWCAYYVTDMAREAGLGYCIPYCGGCTSLRNMLLNDYGAKETSNPQKGDLVFFYCNSSKLCEHIAIVAEVRNGKVTKLIHGNYSNKVCLVNGTAYYDCHGHSVNNGIKLIYVHPKYEKITPPDNKNNTCIKLQSGMKVRLIAKCAPNCAVGCSGSKDFANVKLFNKHSKGTIWTVCKKGAYFYFKNENGYLLDCYGNYVKSMNNIQIHHTLCDTSLFTVKYEADHCYLMFKNKSICLDCYGYNGWTLGTNIWAYSWNKDISQQFIVEKV